MQKIEPRRTKDNEKQFFGDVSFFSFLVSHLDLPSVWCTSTILCTYICTYLSAYQMLDSISSSGSCNCSFCHLNGYYLLTRFSFASYILLKYLSPGLHFPLVLFFHSFFLFLYLTDCNSVLVFRTRYLFSKFPLSPSALSLFLNFSLNKSLYFEFYLSNVFINSQLLSFYGFICKRNI